MTREEVTQAIVAARVERGVNWQVLAEAIDRPAVWPVARVSCPAGPYSRSMVDALPGPTGSPEGFADPAQENYRWLFASAAGVQVDGPPVAFPDQAAAENWLADHHGELADRGIDAVSLLDGERAVYGPMYLEPDAHGPGLADSAF